MGFGVTLNGGTGKEVILGVGVGFSIRAQLAGSWHSSALPFRRRGFSFPVAGPRDPEARPPRAQPEGRK